MTWSKNILDEREAPEQILLGSNDDRLCVLLNLAVYLETAIQKGNNITYLFGDNIDGKRGIRKHLQSIIGIIVIQIIFKN